MQYQAMMATIKEFDQRDSSIKRWTTRKGTSRGALPFTKVSLSNSTFLFGAHALHRRVVSTRQRTSHFGHLAVAF